MLIREADLEPATGLNAITGETGAGKTILAQAIGLLLGAKGDAAFVGPGADGGVRRGRVRRSGRTARGGRARGAGRAAARGRGRARPGAARVRRRADARVRVGQERGAGGPGRGGGAADRDVRPVRAAPARAARRTSSTSSTRSSGEEQLRLRAELRGAWRELGAARRRHEELSRAARRPRRRGSPSCGRSSRTPKGLTADAEDALRAERERLRHVTELAEAAERRAGRRSRPRRARARPASSDGPSGRLAAVAGSRRSSSGRRASSATRSSGWARRRSSCGGSSTRSQAEPGPARAGRGRARADRRRQAALPLRDRTRSSWPERRMRAAELAALEDGRGSVRRPPLRRWPRPRSARRR